MAALPPVAPTVGTTRTPPARPGLLRPGRRSRLFGAPGSDRTNDPRTADPQQVRVSCERRRVADHRRGWGPGAVVTDPEHAAVPRQQRAHYT